MKKVRGAYRTLEFKAHGGQVRDAATSTTDVLPDPAHGGDRGDGPGSSGSSARSSTGSDAMDWTGGATDQVKQESVKAEPVKAEPVKPESVKQPPPGSPPDLQGPMSLSELGSPPGQAGPSTARKVVKGLGILGGIAGLAYTTTHAHELASQIQRDEAALLRQQAAVEAQAIREAELAEQHRRHATMQQTAMGAADRARDKGKGKAVEEQAAAPGAAGPSGVRYVELPFSHAGVGGPSGVPELAAPAAVSTAVSTDSQHSVHQEKDKRRRVDPDALGPLRQGELRHRWYTSMADSGRGDLRRRRLNDSVVRPELLPPEYGHLANVPAGYDGHFEQERTTSPAEKARSTSPADSDPGTFDDVLDRLRRSRGLEPEARSRTTSPAQRVVMPERTTSPAPRQRTTSPALGPLALHGRRTTSPVVAPLGRTTSPAGPAFAPERTTSPAGTARTTSPAERVQAVFPHGGTPDPGWVEAELAYRRDRRALDASIHDEGSLAWFAARPSGSQDRWGQRSSGGRWGQSR